MTAVTAVASPEVAALNELYRTRTGNRIRDRRLALNLTQEEVADRINRWLAPDGHSAAPTGQYVSRWERGSVRPTARYRRLLAVVLECEVADLGFEVGPVPRPKRALAPRQKVVEVWVQPGGVRYVALLVHADESTRRKRLLGQSAAAARREIIGHLIAIGLEPDGDWQRAGDEFVRKMRPAVGLAVQS